MISRVTAFETIPGIDSWYRAIGETTLRNVECSVTGALEWHVRLASASWGTYSSTF
jgi:hypothetical protein